jgi:hypothetical protein
MRLEWKGNPIAFDDCNEALTLELLKQTEKKALKDKIKVAGKSEGGLWVDKKTIECEAVRNFSKWLINIAREQMAKPFISADQLELGTEDYIIRYLKKAKPTSSTSKEGKE